MRMDKLTSRFQAALADAQSLAVGRDNQFIEPAHLLLAMLDAQGGGIAPEDLGSSLWRSPAVASSIDRRLVILLAAS